jgi:hypothetical protein
MTVDGIAATIIGCVSFLISVFTLICTIKIAKHTEIKSDQQNKSDDEYHKTILSKGDDLVQLSEGINDKMDKFDFETIKGLVHDELEVKLSEMTQAQQQDVHAEVKQGYDNGIEKFDTKIIDNEWFTEFSDYKETDANKCLEKIENRNTLNNREIKKRDNYYQTRMFLENKKHKRRAKNHGTKN